MTKHFVVALFTLTLMAAEPSAPKGPAISPEQKLAVKDVESKIWKTKSDRADYMAQSQSQENLLIQQYNALYQNLQKICGDKSHVDDQLNCVANAPEKK